MNKTILNIEIQEFINSNLNSDISSLLFKGIPFKDVDAKTIIEQIEAKKRCEKKLPSWYNSEHIYYPNKINIAQTSSEAAAKYKVNLVSGDTLIDLTGGFGVDTFYFSKKIREVTHCEINSELSEIVRHNNRVLAALNVQSLNENAIDALKRLDQQFDWIYIDPSRRDDSKKKVFLISDCTPNVKTFQGLFLKYANNVMIKTSPLLDIKATLSDLKYVKDIHIIAINNEVKELLWILKQNYEGQVNVQTINIQKERQQVFNYRLHEESHLEANYGEPSNYLYEPNVAILKAGAFNTVSTKLNLTKLHKHSHLYTSSQFIEFPGRCFKIDRLIPYNKKIFAKEAISKANVTTRNFPLSVSDIRKKLKIKDGGKTYLFFTTDRKNTKIIIICSKV